MTLALRIDGLIIDPDSGEILEGELVSIESLIARIRAAQEQEKAWKERVAALKGVVMNLMRKEGLDRVQTDYGTASQRSTESIDRDSLMSLQDVAEITDDEMNAILLESAQQFNVARFRKAAHDRKIDVMDIERAVKRTRWLDVRGTARVAPPIDQVEWN